VPAKAAGFAGRFAVTVLAIDPLPAACTGSRGLSEESGFRPMRFLFSRRAGDFVHKNCE